LTGLCMYKYSVLGIWSEQVDGDNMTTRVVLLLYM
jgi:hypothetical protein